MQRNKSTDAFNKSIVDRRGKSEVIDEIATLIKSNRISAETFQTYDPSFKKWVYSALRSRHEHAFSPERLVSIMNTVHEKLSVSAVAA